MHRSLRLRHWARCDESSGGGRVSSVKLPLLLTLGLLVAGGLIGFFVRSRVATLTPDYLGRGVVVSLLPPPSTLHATRPVIIIHHDPVPGLMEEAMSMPFIAASTKLFEGLRPGDRVAFGLKDTPEALLVVSLERLEPGREK
jgi:hypothetical protein